MDMYNTNDIFSVHVRAKIAANKCGVIAWGTIAQATSMCRIAYIAQHKYCVQTEHESDEKTRVCWIVGSCYFLNLLCVFF